MVFLAALLLGACADTPWDQAWDRPAEPTNVLVVLIDDVGIDKVRSYQPGRAGLPVQPTLDRLADVSVRFETAWAQPACSPTRAALLTGRHPRRVGIGRYLPDDTLWELPLAEQTLPELLAAAPASWETAAVGKWHLSSASSPSGFDHPNLQGFDSYRGWPGNIGGIDYHYEHFRKVVDGVESTEDTYATTDEVDDALDFVRSAGEPWMLFLAPHAAHIPLHVPPAGLHDSVGLDAETSAEADLFGAMVQALDTELDRLLSGIPADVLGRTTVFGLGDNGTASLQVVEPFDPTRAKGTLFETGVRVPLFVAGPLVLPGATSEAMVHVTDLFPTVAGLAGLEAQVDGIDLAPWLADPAAPSGREVLYSDRFRPLGPPPWHEQDLRAVRDERYKLISDDLAGTIELYELVPGAIDDGPALDLDTLDADAADALARLQRALAEHREALTFARY